MQLLVKDFAKSLGVSESIIYRHIRNHREDLGDRIIKKAKQTWITDEGQEYIRGLMIQTPIVVGDADTAMQVAQLHAENEKLLRELKDTYKTIADLGDVKGRLEAAEADRKALEASRDECKVERDIYKEAAENAAQTAAKEAERAARAEAERDAIKKERDRVIVENKKISGQQPLIAVGALIVGIVICSILNIFANMLG